MTAVNNIELKNQILDNLSELAKIHFNISGFAGLYTTDKDIAINQKFYEKLQQLQAAILTFEPSPRELFSEVPTTLTAEELNKSLSGKINANRQALIAIIAALQAGNIDIYDGFLHKRAKILKSILDKVNALENGVQCTLSNETTIDAGSLAKCDTIIAESVFVYESPASRWFNFFRKIAIIFNLAPAKQKFQELFDSVNELWSNIKSQIIESPPGIAVPVSYISALTQDNIEFFHKTTGDFLQIDWFSEKSKALAEFSALMGKLSSYPALKDMMNQFLLDEFVTIFEGDSLRHHFVSTDQFEAYCDILQSDIFIEYISDHETKKRIASIQQKLKSDGDVKTKLADAYGKILKMNLKHFTANLEELKSLPELVNTVFQYGTQGQCNAVKNKLKALGFGMAVETSTIKLKCMVESNVFSPENSFTELFDAKSIIDGLKAMGEKDFQSSLDALKSHYLNVVYNGTAAQLEQLAQLQITPEFVQTGELPKNSKKFTPSRSPNKIVSV